MLLRLFLILICFSTHLVQASTPTYDAPGDVASREGLPSSIVDNVCVISGEYVLSTQDLVIAGPESLTLQRDYSSNGKGSFCRSWSFNHGATLLVGEVNHNDHPAILIGHRQPSGAQLNYLHPWSKSLRNAKQLKFNLDRPKGLTNGGSAISGQTNARNQQIHFFPQKKKIVSITGAGDRHNFYQVGNEKEWALCGETSIEKANGSVYLYDREKCKSSHKTKITCQSKTGTFFGSALLEKWPKDGLMIIKTSDQRLIKYHFFAHKYKNEHKNPYDRGIEETIEKIEDLYLTEIETLYAPMEEYSYKTKSMSKDLQMTQRKKPDGRYQNIHYYRKGKCPGADGKIVVIDQDDPRLNRVKCIESPVGTDQTSIATHRFVYHCHEKNTPEGGKEFCGGTTDVYNALGVRTQYKYDSAQRLIQTNYYEGTASKHIPNNDVFPLKDQRHGVAKIIKKVHGDQNDHFETMPTKVHSKEYYQWSEQGDLLGKITKDGDGNHYSSRYFQYDPKGNVITNILEGNLTGCGTQRDEKHFSYSHNGMNLVLSETDSNGRTIRYRYIDGTNHIWAKYTHYDGRIQRREFYDYNPEFVVIKKIEDDGTTEEKDNLYGASERHITDITPQTNERPFGCPRIVEKKALILGSGEERFLGKTEYHYSPEGWLTWEDVYDANHQHIRRSHKVYDTHGNVVEDVLASGESIRREYDANDNLVMERSSYASYSIHNTYDFANRLISQEERDDDGNRFVITHRYDYLGNCISSTDVYGHETRKTYDSFGHISSTEYPPVLNEHDQLITPITKTEYDIAGHPIHVIDANDNHTHTDMKLRAIELPAMSTMHWIAWSVKALKMIKAKSFIMRSMPTITKVIAFARKLARRKLPKNMTRTIKSPKLQMP